MFRQFLFAVFALALIGCDDRDDVSPRQPP